MSFSGNSMQGFLKKIRHHSAIFPNFAAMQKLQHTEFLSESFFVGALFPFVEEGTLSLLAVQQKDKYKRGQVQTKMPGGTGEQEYIKSTPYFKRLEEVLEALAFDRRAVLLIMNQEYSRRELLENHPQSEEMRWLLQTLVLNCLETTGYYPADLDPFVVDIVERSEDHYQYFLEMKEWWDAKGDPVKIPAPDEDFKPLDEDILVAREIIPMKEFEELLISSHRRPVEFYLEHLQNLVRKVREQDME